MPAMTPPFGGFRSGFLGNSPASLPRLEDALARALKHVDAEHEQVICDIVFVEGRTEFIKDQLEILRPQVSSLPPEAGATMSRAPSTEDLASTAALERQISLREAEQLQLRRQCEELSVIINERRRTYTDNVHQARLAHLEAWLGPPHVDSSLAATAVDGRIGDGAESPQVEASLPPRPTKRTIPRANTVTSRLSRSNGPSSVPVVSKSPPSSKKQVPLSGRPSGKPQTAISTGRPRAASAEPHVRGVSPDVRNDAGCSLQ